VILISKSNDHFTHMSSAWCSFGWGSKTHLKCNVTQNYLRIPSFLQTTNHVFSISESVWASSTGHRHMSSFPKPCKNTISPITSNKSYLWQCRSRFLLQRRGPGHAIRSKQEIIIPWEKGLGVLTIGTRWKSGSHLVHKQRRKSSGYHPFSRFPKWSSQWWTAWVVR